MFKSCPLGLVVEWIFSNVNWAKWPETWEEAYWNCMNRIWVLCLLLSATEIHDLLSMVNSVALKTSDKNTRTRALWVISKQAFPSEIVKKEVSFFTFFCVWSDFLGSWGLCNLLVTLLSVAFEFEGCFPILGKIVRAATDGKKPTNYCFSRKKLQCEQFC